MSAFSSSTSSFSSSSSTSLLLARLSLWVVGIMLMIIFLVCQNLYISKYNTKNYHSELSFLSHSSTAVVAKEGNEKKPIIITRTTTSSIPSSMKQQEQQKLDASTNNMVLGKETKNAGGGGENVGNVRGATSTITTPHPLLRTKNVIQTLNDTNHDDGTTPPAHNKNNTTGIVTVPKGHYNQSHDHSGSNNGDDKDTHHDISIKKENEYDFIWNNDGCQEWPKLMHKRALLLSSSSAQQEQEQKQKSLPSFVPPPSGMVVTVARQRGQGSRGTFEMLCSKLPTQLTYFVQPHQTVDMLLLIDVEGYNITDAARCLSLVPMGTTTNTKTEENGDNEESHERSWHNMDKSTLTTYLYTTSTKVNNDSNRKVKVYLAPFTMPYPDYIAKNMTYLDEPMWDCHDSYDYVSGTRYYSDQFLHLQILEPYEYMIKMDLDIEFKAPIPFNLLWDMKQQGAIFGHTGEFPTGLRACTQGFNNVLQDFINTTKTWLSSSSSLPPPLSSSTTTAHWRSHWKGTLQGKACSAGLPHFDRGYDQYYTNFVVMSRAFFQSEPVRDFGRFMNEYDPGFFKYRWTDQLFFHSAMGMFLGPDFRDYVLDYTELRCRRYPSCWYFWVGKGDTEDGFCRSPGGIFYHSKRLDPFGTFIPPSNTTLLLSPMNSTTFVSKYQHNCENLVD